MRILWAKANKLLPVHSGGDIRSYHLARYLASKHDLTFLSYYDGAPDPAYEKELTDHFPGAVCVCTSKPADGASRPWDYFRHLGNSAPYAVRRFACSEVQRTIEQWFRNDRFDVAVCDFLDAAVNFPSDLKVPSVLFQHNVESEIWRRHASTHANPIKRLMYSVEFRKMLRYESAAVRRFTHVIAVSDHDRKLMTAWVEPSRVTVVPTGVDLQNYWPAKTSGNSLNVAFVGAMDWEPNIDAVNYFCEEIWPNVLSKVPEARFKIIGRNPDRRVQKLASQSVEITGRVPSILEHLHKAAVAVVPLRIGGGTRLKIYEAMAAGKAVVSTTVGAEGLQVHNGKDIILTDSPREFAAAVVSLLLNNDMRHQYETAAAELASRFDWSAIGQEFARVLGDVIAGARPSTEACVAG